MSFWIRLRAPRVRCALTRRDTSIRGMRARILDFVQTLRARGGVEVSVAESLDALVAVAAVGVEREAMREALAAALVKHEADRPVFDQLFDEAFPLVGGAEGAEEGRRRRRARGAG